MKANRFFVVLCVTLGILSLWSSSILAAGEAPVKPVLSSDDCIKCHDGPPHDIASEGKGHKKITCQDCHAGHRPALKDNIPRCSQCHQGKRHYEIKGCLMCHKNPHTPLKILFPDNTTEACLTCHDKQIRQLRENRSKHTALSCTACHGNVHRKKPECLKCHKPHSSDMAASDCGKCHKAHMPKVIMYNADVPSKLCSACHKKAFDLLSASATKHKPQTCAFCHQERHKMIPECQSCHGSPHPAGIMVKFPKCGECHKTAHDLNNWPVTPRKDAPKAVKKK